MRNCGRGFTAALTESGSPQSRLFCIGRLVDYKRRSVGRLRGKFHLTIGRRLTKPAVLYFPCLRHGKCAASPHPAALVRIAVTACMSAETPLSAKLTSPLSGEKLFIAKLIKYFPPLKGRGGGVSRRRGSIPILRRFR